MKGQEKNFIIVALLITAIAFLSFYPKQEKIKEVSQEGSNVIKKYATSEIENEDPNFIDYAGVWLDDLNLVGYYDPSFPDSRKMLFILRDDNSRVYDTLEIDPDSYCSSRQILDGCLVQVGEYCDQNYSEFMICVASVYDKNGEIYDAWYINQNEKKFEKFSNIENIHYNPSTQPNYNY